MDRTLRDNFQNSKIVDADESEREKKKASLVYSLLNEKRRNKGTFHVGPSSVLQQAKNFLPLMKEANSKLKEIASEPLHRDLFNIECVNESDERVIEMDLAFYSESDSDSEASYTENSSHETLLSVCEQKMEMSDSHKQKKNLIQEVDAKQENAQH